MRLQITGKTVVVFILLLISSVLMGNKGNSEAKLNTEEKVNKRFGSLIKVKPEYEERYVILHKHTFPGVLDRIRKSNIRNYSIFLLDGILFSYFEYAGNDYEADMKAIADPTTKEWWKLTDPMQEPLPTRKEGEWWAEMEQLFCLDEIVKPSGEAQRVGLTAEIITGKEIELKKLLENFPKELRDETTKCNFQNANIFIKDGKIYYYYEYAGNDIRKSFGELSKNEKFKSFQDEMSKLLVPKANGPWEVMKEVFHTN